MQEPERCKRSKYMTYELINQLKEAGFPFRHAKTSDDILYTVGEVPLAIPTLSELIEACGDGLDSLQKGSWKGSGKWLAYKSYWDDVDNHYEPQEPVGRGNTPEEAVANLWLELNKKL